MAVSMLTALTPIPSTFSLNSMPILYAHNRATPLRRGLLMPLARPSMTRSH